MHEQNYRLELKFCFNLLIKEFYLLEEINALFMIRLIKNQY